MKSARVLVGVLAMGASSCFVSEGDCVARGVNVNPCAITAKAGQTVILRATIPGAPGEPVDWILPASAADAFVVEASSNQLTLISKQNVPGSFPVQASSQTNPLLYGGSAVGVASASFGGQAPPIVFFGGDLPVGSKAGATAAGGNLYYVAYAGVGVLLPDESALGPVPSTNFFLQQYDIATNQLRTDVPNQFLLFNGQGGSPIFPNVEADCQGNGYWVDRLGTPGNPFVLRRLAASGPPIAEQALAGFAEVRPRSLAVTCDGILYFIGRDGSGKASLYRLASFASPPVLVDTGKISLFFTSPLAVDGQGRLLLGDDSNEAAPVSRVIVDVTIPALPLAIPDPTFAPANIASSSDVSVDDFGVVYYAEDRFPTGGDIVALNSAGDEVYRISAYTFFCPSGCADASCGSDVPFTRIVSLDASGAGALRVVDDPDTAALATGCQEALRLVLIDPQ